MVVIMVDAVDVVEDPDPDPDPDLILPIDQDVEGARD